MSVEDINLNKKLEEIKIKANFKDLKKLKTTLLLFQGIFTSFLLFIIINVISQITGFTTQSSFPGSMQLIFAFIICGSFSLIFVNYCLAKIIDIIGHLLS
jgi:hypothetical protein